MHEIKKRLGKQERQDRILAELQASPAIRILDLAERFAVSTETVRRDLDELSRDGLINRTYGGAAGAPLVLEPSLDERYRTKTNERIRIGRMASHLVVPGDVLMIDAGATTIYVARRLAADIRDLTVITTSFGVASALAATPSIRIIVCPGDFDPREGGVVGPDTLAFLRRFHAAKAIIGASGLGSEGPTEASSSSAWIKRVMIERSVQAILVIDQTKFGQTMFEVVCPLSDLDHLVTDAAPIGSLQKSLAKANVTLHVAQ